MIYFDNSATTPVSKNAADAMHDMLIKNFGNPSSTHFLGIKAAKALDEARQNVASAIGCDKEEIYFSSSGTVANNTAIFGSVLLNRRKGKRIVTSSLEHPSVSECMKRLSDEGFDVVYLPVDKNGNYSLEDLKSAITKDTILVSIMLINNEIGTINDVKNIKKAVKTANSPAIIHCDAVQAFGKINIKPSMLGVDLMTVSSHKIHGPKGAGALYVRRGLNIKPYILGGGQEKGLIAGTEAMPAIVGFGEACKEINYKEQYDYILNLRDYAASKISQIDNVFINSPEDALPYIINISIPKVPSEVTVNFMSENGICVSAGSACKKGHRSDVLTKIGLSPERLDSSIRISFSANNTTDEVDIFIDKLNQVIRKVRT
ncbi:MAG TPA: cysteine desulfurase [Clostridiales bacterium]|nr:cysteine desulfurase [Clostridiales bacterium]